MSDGIVSPSGPWQAGRSELSIEQTLAGRGDIGWGTVTTADQTLAGALRLYTYRLQTDPAKTDKDYYAVFGNMSQGIQHGQPYKPAPNWLSVGYYAPAMSLVLELKGNGVVWDSGPGSTVGSNSTGFNIGANLGFMAGDLNAAQGGVSAGFSASFASPDVVTGHAAVGKLLRWDISLPGVGFVSPGNPANPKEPSFAGYRWYFGAIYELPKNEQFSLRVHPRVEWHFDYTRGITNDVRTWDVDETHLHKAP